MQYNSMDSIDTGEGVVTIPINGRREVLYDFGTTIISHEEVASCLSEVLGEVLSVDDIPLKVCC